MAGSFCLVLHSHIPYCKKSGVWPAGEEWLFEAMNECYIPLLIALRRLVLEGIRPGITVGVVPILAEQLSDGYMKARFLEYMGDKIVRAQHDMERFKDDPARRRVAEYWVSVFEGNVRAYVKDFHQDILGTLTWLQDERAVEVITSAATHGFLPLMERDSAVYAQVKIGVETYERTLREKAARLLAAGVRVPARRRRQGKTAARRSTSGSPISGSSGSSSRASGSNRPPSSRTVPDCGAPTTDRGYRLALGRGRLREKRRHRAAGMVGRGWLPLAPGIPRISLAGAGDGPALPPGDGKRDERDLRSRKGGPACQEGRGPLREAAFGRGQAGRRGGRSVAGYRIALRHGALRPLVARGAGVYRGGLPEPWRKSVIFLPCGSGTTSTPTGTAFQTIEMGRTSWGENGDFTVWQNPEHGWIWPLINDCCRQMEEVLAGIEKAGLRAGRARCAHPQADGARITADAGQRLALLALYRAGARIREPSASTTTTSGS